MKNFIPLFHSTVLFTLVAGGCTLDRVSLTGQGSKEERRDQGVTTRSLFDFEGTNALRVMTCSKAVQASLTSQGVVSGEQAVELRYVSADKCPDDDWRRFFVNFPVPLDASNFSRIAFDVTNPGDQDIGVHVTLYNDPSNNDWGWDGDGGVVPPRATRTIHVDLKKLGRALQPKVDISRVSRIGLSTGRDADVVMHVDQLRLEFDPAVGSPALRLEREARQLLRVYRDYLKRIAWNKVSPDRRASLQTFANAILARIDDVVTACQTAQREGGFAGTYHAANTGLHDLKEANEIGRLFLLGQPVFYAWEISPYVNIFKQEFPGPESKPLRRIKVAMARQEYRDAVFMVSNNGDGDQRIELSLETADRVLKDTTLVQEALYLKNAANQDVGGAHDRLSGPLAIPQGQSRQVRLRFDAKEGGLAPGRHPFLIRLKDRQHSHEQVIRGMVEVWDFALPDPAESMSNNTYSDFSMSSLTDLRDLMVKDMKSYGLNVFFVDPSDVTVKQSDGRAQFSFAKLDDYVRTVMSNWGGGPHPQFIFSLACGVMPPEKDLGEWAQQFRTVLESHGVKLSDWYFVLGDESNASKLLTFELPRGEMLRRRVPWARISSNTSAMMKDRAAQTRYFATVDRWEPDFDIAKANPELLPYLRATGKPINLYRCRETYSVRGANLHNYYRGYGWEAARQGCVGMGLWVYCEDRHMDPWTNKEYHCALVFRHPTKRALVHSRRYEAFREGIDDYRYIWKLRDLARARGPQTQAEAGKLIRYAVADITAAVADTGRCEKWRHQIARKILKLSQAPHDAIQLFSQHDLKSKGPR